MAGILPSRIVRVKVLVSTSVVHTPTNFVLMKRGELVDCAIEQVKTRTLGKGTIHPLYGELSQQAGTHQGRDAGGED